MAPNVSKLTRKFVRLQVANLAFVQVKAHAEHMIESNFKEGDLLLTPHFAGLVVTYAKNFTESEGMGPLPQTFAELPLGALRHTHSILIEARHKLYAHRDVTASMTFPFDDETSSPPYEVAVEFSKEKGLSCFPNIPELSLGILGHVRELCDFQIQRIHEETANLLPLLVNGRTYKEGTRYVAGIDFP